MYGELSQTTETSDPRYADRLDVIASVKTMEKAYIEEVLVTPNAFDVYTGNDPLSKLWEVFRRYPVLFVSQHVFRKSNRVNPVKWGFGLMSMMILDIVYMMLLRMANGYRYEDLMKDFEEDPWGMSVTYFTRLPVLGRYGGLIAEGAATILNNNRMGGTPGAFIPGAALVQIVRQGVGTAESFLDDKPTKYQDLINTSRVVPILGDALTRLAFYGGSGDLIDRRKRKSKGGSTRSAGPQNLHYGLHQQEINFTYPRLAGMLLEEIAPDRKWQRYDLKQNFTLPGANVPAPAAPQPTPEAPEKPVQAPQAAPAPTSIGDAILESNRPQEAPEGLLQ
jgi:hypothetical protein